jgi:hypothetical protein
MPAVAIPNNLAQFLAEHRIRLVAGALILITLVVIWRADGSVQLMYMLLALPLMVGAIVPLLSLPGPTARIESCEAIFELGLSRARRKDGKFAKYFQRPLYSGSRALWKGTALVKDRHIRAGLCLAVALYFWAVMIVLLVVAVYIVLAVIVAIALVGWVLSLYYGGHGGGGYTRRVRTVTGRRKQEHFSRAGQKIGESIETTTFRGEPRTVNFDAAGNRVGESRQESPWTGAARVVHYDKNGDRSGESRPTTTLLGNDVVEHFDASGHKTGESRTRQTLLGGDVVEHSQKD